jgi:hypothetical protein
MCIPFIPVVSSHYGNFMDDCPPMPPSVSRQAVSWLFAAVSLPVYQTKPENETELSGKNPPRMIFHPRRAVC